MIWQIIHRYIQIHIFVKSKGLLFDIPVAQVVAQIYRARAQNCRVRAQSRPVQLRLGPLPPLGTYVFTYNILYFV